MRKTALLLVVLITGLVLLVEKTRDAKGDDRGDRDDAPAQLLEAR
jgi:hypothetical protein